MTRLRLSRRVVLTALGLVATSAGALLGCARSPVRGPEAQNALVERLVMLLRKPSFARELGRAYLWRRHPCPDRHELVDHILPLKSQRALMGAPRWQLRRVVRERIEADYARGRPTSVAGWMLSDTEACLCALTVEDDN